MGSLSGIIAKSMCGVLEENMFIVLSSLQYIPFKERTVANKWFQINNE